jgi:hypothetical protein
MLITFIPKNWLLALGGGVITYLLFEKERDSTKKLKEVKLEIIEQQRTIDRLRAELGRERQQRQEVEDKKDQEDKQAKPDDQN